MDVLNSTNNLLKEAHSFLFFELFALDDVLKKFTAWRIFHYEKKLSAGLDDL